MFEEWKITKGRTKQGQKRSQTPCEMSRSKYLSKQGEGGHAGGVGGQLQFASFSTERRNKSAKPHSHDTSDAIILFIFVTPVMSLSFNSNSAAFIATQKCVCMVFIEAHRLTRLLASS